MLPKNWNIDIHDHATLTQHSIHPNSQLKGTPHGQLKGAPHGQRKGAPHSQLKGVSYNQLKGAPHGQLKGAPQKQLNGAPHGQLKGAPQKQLNGAPHGQLKGALHTQLKGAPSGIHPNRTRHEYAKKCWRYDLSKVINDTPAAILDKINTLKGFVDYIKHCTIVNCYICSRNWHFHNSHLPHLLSKLSNL